MTRLYYSPPSIIAQVEQAAPTKNFVLAEKPDLKFNTKEELIYYITHEIPNIKHKDGRIYMKINDNGELFANSLSPYSEIFLDNIEERIKPMVLALQKKRYLTYSSCEGHGFSFRRYVGMAFADETTRSYVANEITNLKLPGVSVKYLSSVTNQKMDRNMKGEPIFTKKFNEVAASLQEEEVNNFNIQFHRSYTEFYFLEIVILKEAKMTMRTLLNDIWLIFLKKYFWDKITNKITEHILSDKFKKYPY